MSETRDEGGAAMSGGGGGGPEEDEAAPMVVTLKEPARKRCVYSVFSLSLSLSIYLPFSLSIRRARLTRAAPSLGTLGNENAKGRVGGVQRVSWLRGQD